jgi:alpha-glucosidase
MPLFPVLMDKIKIALTAHFLQPLLDYRRIPRRWRSRGTCLHYTTNRDIEKVSFDCEHGFLSLKCLSSNILEVETWREMPPERSWIFEGRKGAKLEIEAREGGQVSVMGAEDGGLKAVLDRQDSSLTFAFGERERVLFRSLTGNRGDWIFHRWRSSEPELYLGFGEKTGGLFKNGRRLVMWNTDNSDIGPRSDPLYQSCPLQIALRKDGTAHGIYFDNPRYGCFRIGNRGAAPESLYAAEGEALRYFVLAGPDIAQVIAQFTELTGHYPLPPRWVLGHHHSRWEHEDSAERILNLAAEFRDHRIPCDALHLDIGHMEGFRSFTWSETRFPDPGVFVRKLHEMDFKAVVITDPGIKRDDHYDVYRQGQDGDHFCRAGEGIPHHGPVWAGPSAFPDFTSASTRRWWGDLFSIYLDAAVDGVWNDMNEPSLFTPRRTLPSRVIHRPDGLKEDRSHRELHNLYGYLMARASFEGLARLRPGQRNFLFTRSSFAGIQRYASSWTGDNRSNWAHLRMSIPMLLNMGLSGQILVGPDIGGFWGKPSKELMIRWIQLGSFYPFSRNHTSRGTPPQELWSLGKEVEEVGRRYLGLRYSLLPYLYTCLREGCQFGLPVMRPLFVEFSGDEGCYAPAAAESEFLVGPNLLVAPILHRGARERMVHLPDAGSWFDWWSGDRCAGGQSHRVEAPLDKLPLFVRGGAVLATCLPAQFSEKTEKSPLTLLVYPVDGNARGEIYLDDGTSLAYRGGQYSLIEVNVENAADESEGDIRIERKEGHLEPPLWRHPTLTIRILGKPPSGIITNLLANGSRWDWKTDGDWTEISDLKPELPITVSIQRAPQQCDRGV